MTLIALTLLVLASLAHGQFEVSNVVVTATEVRCPLFDYLAGNLTIQTTQNSADIIIGANGLSSNFKEVIILKAHGVEVGRFQDNQFVGPAFFTSYILPLPGKTDLTIDMGAGSTHFSGNIDFGGAAITGGFHVDSSFVIVSPNIIGAIRTIAPIVGALTIDASAVSSLTRLVIPDVVSLDTIVFNGHPATLTQKTLVAPTTDSLSPSPGNPSILMGPLKMQGDINMNGFCLYNTACLNLSSPVDIEGTHKTQWSGVWDSPLTGDVRFHRRGHTVSMFVPQVIGLGNNPGIISMDTKLPDDLRPVADTRLVISMVEGGDVFGTAIAYEDGSLWIGAGAGLNPFTPPGLFKIGWYRFTMTYDVK